MRPARIVISLVIIFIACVVYGQVGNIERPQPADVYAVTNGFVFIDGRYIDTPYSITCQGLAVVVNGIVVDSYEKLVVNEKTPNLPADGNSPEIPPAIDRHTSMQDEVLRDYLFNLASYFEKKYQHQQAADQMARALERLPCVAKVERTAKEPGKAVVTFYSGQTVNINLMLPTRKPMITKATAPQYVAKACINYAERLNKGDCYFFSSHGGRGSFAIGMAKDILPRLVQILNSSENIQTKAEKIKALNLPVSSDAYVLAIVTNNISNKQLTERINTERSIEIRGIGTNNPSDKE